MGQPELWKVRLLWSVQPPVWCEDVARMPLGQDFSRPLPLTLAPGIRRREVNPLIPDDFTGLQRRLAIRDKTEIAQMNLALRVEDP